MCLASIALMVLGLGGFVGIRHAELTRHPDEPAHFTTGVMVFDYLRTSLPSDPVTFAESYYLHYPKVAFSHWPPVFYFVQAIWYCVFGPTKLAVRVLAGLVTFLTAASLFCRLRRSYGRLLALLAVSLFLSLPMVRFHSSAVMADMLVSFFCLLAFFAYCDFLASGSLKRAGIFAGWATLAVLTKGNALALAPFALLAVLAVGRPDILRTRAFWVAGLLVIAVAGPFYGMSFASGAHAYPSLGRLLSLSVAFLERVKVVKGFCSLASPVVFLVAMAGAVAALLESRRGACCSRAGFDSAAASAWLVAVVLFQVVCPITGPERYFLPALLPLTILAAHGLDRLRSRLGQRHRTAGWVLLVLLIALSMATVREKVGRWRQGYASVAESIPFCQSGPVILISSDSLGEGAFIAERLERDRSRGGFVLRASKVLAEESWMGRSYRLRKGSGDDIRQYLDEVPVHFVVLDDFGYAPHRARPHHRLLREAIESESHSFRLVGKFPIVKGDERVENAIAVYENRRARGRPPGRIEVDMSSTLGRTLRWQAK